MKINSLAGLSHETQELLSLPVNIATSHYNHMYAGHACLATPSRVIWPGLTANLTVYILSLRLLSHSHCLYIASLAHCLTEDIKYIQVVRHGIPVFKTPRCYKCYLRQA